MRVLSTVAFGCLATALCSCSLESEQSASECEAALVGRTAAMVQQIPSQSVLLRDARSADPQETGIIAHELWGNKEKFPALAHVLQARGFRTSVEPEEYGDHLRIDEPVESFRHHATERVRQFCELGDRMNLRYNGWWLWAGHHSEYVTQ